MILGVGIDLVNIDRIGRTLERFGDRFKERVFHPIEQETAEARRGSVASYAKRWAAKEACSKALGTGVRMGVAWRDMWVVNLQSGQPTLCLAGWAKARLEKMLPEGHAAHIHLTLTDDHPWAQAMVQIEARSIMLP